MAEAESEERVLEAALRVADTWVAVLHGWLVRALAGGALVVMMAEAKAVSEGAAEKEASG